MSSRSSSAVVTLMAFLTLGMVIVLPILGGGKTPTTIAATAALSSDQMALERSRTAMVRVAGGEFTRGTWEGELDQAVRMCTEQGGLCDASIGADSLPAHLVRVDAFWVETTEVTYRQYVNFLNTLGARSHVDGCDGQMCVITRYESNTSAISFDGTGYDTSNPAIDDFPVVNVTWYGAQAYCGSLGRRLPTEAEWEYAARGQHNNLYPWGDAWTYEAANVRGSTRSGESIIAGPQPVGGHVEFASPDGVRDLAGNVAEWTADWYQAGFYALPEASFDNPAGPLEGTERVVRGGSWNDVPFYARAVQRAHLAPDDVSSSVGFRCVSDE